MAPVAAVQVGPQASCSGYADRMSSDLATAEQQGRARPPPRSTPRRASGSGGAARSTTTSRTTTSLRTTAAARRCRSSPGWTKALRGSGYRSGVYSNIAAAITSLDYAHRVSPGSYAMPDDIWFAWDNGRSDVRTDKRVLSDEWDDHDRVHQYALDVTQTFGGYPLVVDANWVDVGRGSVGTAAAAVPWRRRRPAALPDAGQGTQRRRGQAAQCLLRRQGSPRPPSPGRTTPARPPRSARPSAGSTCPRPAGSPAAPGPGCSPAAASRCSRWATPATRCSGSSAPSPRRSAGPSASTASSTRGPPGRRGYQRKQGLPATGVVTPEVWDRLTWLAQAARPSRARLTTSSAGLAVVAGAPIRRVPVWSTR